MKRLLLLLCLPIFLFSCKNNSEKNISEKAVPSKNFEEINQLQWLEGTWTNETGEEFSQETWERENDSTFTAFGFTQVKKEVVFAETMALEQIGKDVLLTVVEADQIEKKPVTFRLVSTENGDFVFENKNHDFPNRIIYTSPAADSLHAWIEGKVNGEHKKVDFYFSRKE